MPLAQWTTSLTALGKFFSPLARTLQKDCRESCGVPRRQPKRERTLTPCGHLWRCNTGRGVRAWGTGVVPQPFDLSPVTPSDPPRWTQLCPYSAQGLLTALLWCPVPIRRSRFRAAVTGLWLSDTEFSAGRRGGAQVAGMSSPSRKDFHRPRGGELCFSLILRPLKHRAQCPKHGITNSLPMFFF